MKAFRAGLIVAVLVGMAAPVFAANVFTTDYPATKDMFYGRALYGTASNYGTSIFGRVGKLAIDGYIVDFDRAAMLSWVNATVQATPGGAGIALTDVSQLGNGALTMTMYLTAYAGAWQETNTPPPTMFGHYYWPGVRLSKGSNWDEMTGTFSAATPGVSWHDKNGGSIVSIYGGFNYATCDNQANMVMNAVSEPWGADNINGGTDIYVEDIPRPWQLDGAVAFAALKNPDAVGFQVVADFRNKPWCPNDPALPGTKINDDNNGQIYAKDHGSPEFRPWVNIILDADKLIANSQVKTYLPGDANKDGYVKFADYLILEQNFGKSGKTWAEGDFTGDGTVKFADYLLLEQNFGKKASWAVPEPATMSLLILGGIAMLKRRSA